MCSVARDVATPKTKTTGREGWRESRRIRSCIAGAAMASNCWIMITRGGLAALLYLLAYLQDE